MAVALPVFYSSALTFKISVFGETGNYWRGEKRGNNGEMKTLHFHIKIKVIYQIAWEP
jgi:hypothetical protein